MMASAKAVHFVVLLSLCVDLLLAGAVVKVKFVRLKNDGGHQYGGRCCDWFCRQCDHELEICLDVPNGNDGVSSCRYRYHKTDHWQDQNNIEFGNDLHGLSNPFQTKVSDWKGGFKLKVKAWEDDMTYNDYIDTVLVSLYITAPSNGAPSSVQTSTLTGREGHVSLTIQYSAWCELNYYGSDCNKKCVPNMGGHYICSSGGDKICSPGWEGADCNRKADDCINNQCQNEARCVDGVQSYTCQCKQGYTGRFCEMDINECIPSPCQNGGQCTDGVAEFTCTCQPGYVGPTCADHVCNVSSPCQNNGTCYDDGKCLCSDNFAGDQCETDTCLNVTCLNGGSCIGGNCTCVEGYNGNQCQTNIDDCITAACMDNSTCVDRIAGYLCTCSKGFYGTHCEHFDECSRGPCINGGTCMSGTTGYQCNCSAGYRGIHCEISPEVTQTSSSITPTAKWKHESVETTSVSDTFSSGNKDANVAIEHKQNGFHWEPLLAVMILIAVLVTGIIIGIMVRRRRSKPPPSPPSEPQGLGNFDNPLYNTGVEFEPADSEPRFSTALPEAFPSIDGASTNSAVGNVYENVKRPISDISSHYDSPKALMSRAQEPQGAVGGVPCYAVPRLTNGPINPPPYEETPSENHVYTAMNSPGYNGPKSKGLETRDVYIGVDNPAYRARSEETENQNIYVDADNPAFRPQSEETQNHNVYDCIDCPDGSSKSGGSESDNLTVSGGFGNPVYQSESAKHVYEEADLSNGNRRPDNETDA